MRLIILSIFFLSSILFKTQSVVAQHDGLDGSRFHEMSFAGLQPYPGPGQPLTDPPAAMNTGVGLYYRKDFVTAPGMGGLGTRVRPIIGIVGTVINRDRIGSWNLGFGDLGMGYSWPVAFGSHWGDDFIYNQNIFSHYARALLSSERSIGCTPSATTICPVTYGNSPGVPSVSEDGQWVVFSDIAGSYTWNANDVVGRGQIFLKRYIDPTRGLVTNTSFISDGDLIPISKTPAGAPSNNTHSSNSYNISADGSCVVYNTRATDIVAGQSPSAQYTNYLALILYDRASATNTLIQDNLGHNGLSIQPAVSRNCSWVAYHVNKDQAGCTNSTTAFARQIKLLNIRTGASYFPSRYPMSGAAGVCADGLSLSRPTISDNGRYIAFSTHGNSLSAISGPAYDNNNAQDIYLADRLAGTVVRVSKGYSSNPANNLDSAILDPQGAVAPYSPLSSDPVLSGDGAYIAFISTANNLQQQMTIQSSYPIPRDFYLGGSAYYTDYDNDYRDIYLKRLWDNSEPQLVTYSREGWFNGGVQWGGLPSYPSGGLSFRWANFAQVSPTDSDYQYFKDLSGPRCLFAFNASTANAAQEFYQMTYENYGPGGDGVSNLAVFGSMPCPKPPRSWNIMQAVPSPTP